jgi:hypothetical protein
MSQLLQLKLKNRTLQFHQINKVNFKHQKDYHSIIVDYDNMIESINYTTMDFKFFIRDYNWLVSLIKKEEKSNEE